MTANLFPALLAVAVTALGPSNAAFATCSMAIPATPDISAYGTLQLPVSTNDDGKPGRITGKSLQGYSSPYFERQGSQSIVMRVPTNGLVSTPHSKYPRSELKENQTWSLREGCAVEAARLMVLALPQSGDIVIGQVHQEAAIPRPPLELHYTNGRVHADVLKQNTTEPDQPRTALAILDGVPLNQPFSYVITVEQGGLVRVSVNGVSRSIQLDSSFDQARLYFKAGNYTLDARGGSVVAFQGLGITHD